MMALPIGIGNRLFIFAEACPEPNIASQIILFPANWLLRLNRTKFIDPSPAMSALPASADQPPFPPETILFRLLSASVEEDWSTGYNIAANEDPLRRFRVVAYLCSVYCFASFLQGRFHGQILRRKFFDPVVNRFGSLWVLYQCVIALPAVLELMNFHFDFYTFVNCLDHIRHPFNSISKQPIRRRARFIGTSSKETVRARFTTRRLD
jgi:hypothetical protein